LVDENEVNFVGLDVLVLEGEEVALGAAEAVQGGGDDELDFALIDLGDHLLVLGSAGDTLCGILFHVEANHLIGIRFGVGGNLGLLRLQG
jgi:hypothetical protein